MCLFTLCASQAAERAAHSGSRCWRTFSASPCPSLKTRKARLTAPRCLQWSARASTRPCAKFVQPSSVRFVCWSHVKKSGSYTRRDIEYTSDFIQQFEECEIGNWTNLASQIRNFKLDWQAACGRQSNLRCLISDI